MKSIIKTPMKGIIMNKQKTIGLIAIAIFFAAIPFANYWLTKFGFYNAPLLGPIPSGLWVVAVSFVARDIAQITLGRRATWLAIAVGTLATWFLASPGLALASGIAFLISESTDAAIFTPLANRGRFLLGVIVSGYLAGFVDSAVFLRIAFDSWSGWWQMGIAKGLIVLLATPFAWGVRRVLLREPLR
jgi:uncharacterized PurR-regulated membrane protein YhhQ (DUF165 family)